MKIAIASGKGGTGKTTLSVNLASYLAIKKEVTLVDLDVEEPNSGLFIQAKLLREEIKFSQKPEWIEGRCTQCGLCHEVCNFNAIIQMKDQIIVFPELCHSCYACSELCPTNALPMKNYPIGVLKHFKKGTLCFIESRLNIGQEQAVPLITLTHKYIEKHFTNNDLIFYDAPPGTSCPVIEATKNADFVILVTEPTPFGLYDLKLAVKTIKELNINFGVVINRDGLGDEAVDSYCRENKIEVLAKIPNDRKIAEIYAKGDLIYPNHLAFKNQLSLIEKSILKHFKETRR